jgi:hypothetical protein
MQTDVKQVFYFHADARSVGGFVEGPFRHIPSSCSVSLSSTGGSHSTEVDKFDFEDHIHHRTAYTHVSGKHAKRNGPWTQHCTSVVEDFKLLDRVTADRFVAQIAIEHPEAGGGGRRVSFAGSRIENLRIDGKPVTFVLNPVLLPEKDRTTVVYNKDSIYTPDITWPTLWKTAYSQAVDLLKQPDLPEWVRARFGWIAARENTGTPNAEGHTLCSLVDKLEGLAPEQSFGHCIDLPDLGRIFLGEVTVFHHAVNLTMIRAELGCKLVGQMDGGSVGSNGTTIPPG